VQILIYVALLGWIPVCLGLFMALPARQAAVAGIIGAWLFLPPLSIRIATLPDYDKSMAAVVGIILATLIFQPHRLINFRARWFDLPVLIWCLCPIASSLSNDLGLYDGLSASRGNFIWWGFPYLIGRLYFGDREGVRELTIGIVIGGLLYVLPCLYEMRMSPILQTQIYGISGYEGMRMGGYRPKVFFSVGLELGMWMTAVSLTVVWLWKGGALKRIGAYSVGGAVLPILLITTILCRSTGALLLMIMGLSVLWASTRFNTKLLMWAFLFTGPIYYAARIPNYWDGKDFGSLVRTYFSEERAQSFEFRLENENLLAAKAMLQPTWGWAGWGRNRAVDEHGTAAVTDGMWVVYLGTYGFVGLASWTLLIVLPSWLFTIRYPVRSWATPAVAPLAAVATLLGLYMIDCLMNSFHNLVYVVASGSLICAMPSRVYRGKATASSGSHDRNPGVGHRGLHHEWPDVLPSALDIPASGMAGPPPSTSREQLARRYLKLARSLKDRKQFDEARTAWTHALTLLSELASAEFALAEIQKARWDCANDFAWFLLGDRSAAVENVPWALQLASQATQADPENGVYWNTLGAACYRAGDFTAAIAALERSMSLNGQHNAFDHLIMAMAHTKQGQREEALRWYDRAVSWIGEHDCHDPGLLALYEEAGAVLGSRDLSSSAP
jgi:tetratricopeptide (TPR) repeat protein